MGESSKRVEKEEVLLKFLSDMLSVLLLVNVLIFIALTQWFKYASFYSVC